MNISASLARTTRLLLRPAARSCSSGSGATSNSPTTTVTNMVSNLQSPLFTQQVVNAMRTLYPEELADRSWDNVGLLQGNIDPSSSIGAGWSTSRPVSPIVLLTNDLTIRVAEEAIRKKASIIVTYHPFIFRGLKSVTLADPQQRILLQLAQNNIAVYSPHTAIDAAPGGMNDWLADILEGHSVSTKRSVVQPINQATLPEGFGGAGYGRLVELAHPVNLGAIVQAYAEGLGGLRYVMVARPKASAGEPEHVMPISSVAICAGSGYDVLKNCKADLFVTGEMTHHSALKLTMEGKYVITVFHSNSERRFLKKRLQPLLQTTLRKEDPVAEVLVSEEDEDPFEIWDVKNLPPAALLGSKK
ncbi:GTP cyclohydrolase 1 type 2/Nif3 [Bombardia bombarda]|uniref:GTP cyclohydrolase 1 type 2/Nif3 n=1 Tax=Bombardia bombarda TaxID=252184 RepID=A0AA40C4Q0_9PEZI|nr:GTP cyclohydrolase 1 type 2/Nif3 [Bombardia bombarda]